MTTDERNENEPQPGDPAASDAEWRERLSPEQFRVLRQCGTEPPFRNAYWNEKRPGMYACAGCGQELFSSAAKFDSGSGWPSYWQAVDAGAIIERVEQSHGMVRTEVVCGRCGGHLGHLFDDAPQTPTGLRYCINSAALVLHPEDQPPPA